MKLFDLIESRFENPRSPLKEEAELVCHIFEILVRIGVLEQDIANNMVYEILPSSASLVSMQGTLASTLMVTLGEGIHYALFHEPHSRKPTIPALLFTQYQELLVTRSTSDIEQAITLVSGKLLSRVYDGPLRDKLNKLAAGNFTELEFAELQTELTKAFPLEIKFRDGDGWRLLINLKSYFTVLEEERHRREARPVFTPELRELLQPYHMTEEDLLKYWQVQTRVPSPPYTQAQLVSLLATFRQFNLARTRRREHEVLRFEVFTKPPMEPVSDALDQALRVSKAERTVVLLDIAPKPEQPHSDAWATHWVTVLITRNRNSEVVIYDPLGFEDGKDLVFPDMKKIRFDDLDLNPNRHLEELFKVVATLPEIAHRLDKTYQLRLVGARQQFADAASDGVWAVVNTITFMETGVFPTLQGPNETEVIESFRNVFKEELKEVNPRRPSIASGSSPSPRTSPRTSFSSTGSRLSSGEDPSEIEPAKRPSPPPDDDSDTAKRRVVGGLQRRSSGSSLLRASPPRLLSGIISQQWSGLPGQSSGGATFPAQSGSSSSGFTSTK